jgi:hypothetical protein
MHDGHVHVAGVEACGRLQPEQAAADHDRFRPRLRRDEHGVDVVEIAVAEDTGEIVARYREDQRRGARCDDELVVGLHHAAIGGDRLGTSVDSGDLVPLVKRDAVLDVPAVAVDDDLFEVLLAGKHRREHDAVVVDARLGVEDRDLIAAGRALEQMLEHSPRSHAVADDDEFFAHVRCRSLLGCIKSFARRNRPLRPVAALHAPDGDIHPHEQPHHDRE